MQVFETWAQGPGTRLKFRPVQAVCHLFKVLVGMPNAGLDRQTLGLTCRCSKPAAVPGECWALLWTHFAPLVRALVRAAADPGRPASAAEAAGSSGGSDRRVAGGGAADNAARPGRVGAPVRAALDCGRLWKGSEPQPERDSPPTARPSASLLRKTYCQPIAKD